MSEKKELPNLFNLVDDLVKIRNTYNDYKPYSKIKKDTLDFLCLENDFNNTIKKIQTFYDYIDYDKMIKENNVKDYTQEIREYKKQLEVENEKTNR